jgi:outer membrane protein assembly factor BamB
MAESAHDGNVSGVKGAGAQVILRVLKLTMLVGLSLVLDARSAVAQSNPGAQSGSKGTDDWPCWRGPNGDGKSPLKDICKDWTNGLKMVWEVGGLGSSSGSTWSWSAPSVKGNRLVVPGRHGTKDVIYCFDAETGAPVWEQEYSAPAPPGRGEYGAGPRATPCIDGDRVYTFGRYGHLACWDLQNGMLIWMKHIETEGGGRPGPYGLSSSPVVYEGLVMVAGDGKAQAIAFDKQTGTCVWKFTTGQGG